MVGVGVEIGATCRATGVSRRAAVVGVEIDSGAGRGVIRGGSEGVCTGDGEEAARGAMEDGPDDARGGI